MPTNANTLISYGDASRREDLLDIITNITPKETQLLSGLKQSTAKNTLHEWLTDTLGAVGHNAAVEGNDVTPGALTTPSRVVNFTQIVNQNYQVSDTQRAINQAGYEDQLAYQIQKAMKEWANDAELALMQGTQASGNASVGRQMRGVIEFISSNATAHTSGTNTLNEDRLNDSIQDAWDDGGNTDEIYVDATFKRRISSFTANATKNVDTTDKRLVNAVDIYESDFGVHKIFKHRRMPSGVLVNIQSDLWRTAYLRKPQQYELGKTGSSSKGFIEGELTLEALNEVGNSKRTGLV